MRTPYLVHTCLTVPTFALVMMSTSATTLRAQQVSDAPGPAEVAILQDLPLTVEERQSFIGSYSVTLPDPKQDPLNLRIFEGQGVLMGAFGGNDPTRMLYQGNNVFRPEAAAEFEATFTLADGRATTISIVSPEGVMKGTRLDDKSSEGTTAGDLFDELERMDRLVFDAAFLECDNTKLNDFIANDIEFYHDLNGFQKGQQVRDSFRELAESCSAGRGPRRDLEQGSLGVYPIHDYGAVQTGIHRFIHPDGSPDIVAKFVHLWKKNGEGWMLTRVLSFDHRPDHASPNPH